MPIKSQHPVQLKSSALTVSEQVQACCVIAREQLEKGNYDGGCASLRPWWTLSEGPRHDGLTSHAAAELLLTAGMLSGWIASTRRVHGDQKTAEALLNGAISLFDHLGENLRAAEGGIELSACYYREGLFDIARATLQSLHLILRRNRVKGG